MGAAAGSGRSLAWSGLRKGAAPTRYDSTNGPRSACLATPFPGLVLAARDEPVNLSDSRLGLISIVHQPVLIAASRCYLIQMLGSALTCTNDCSCWSPDEENRPRVFPYHGCALPTELGGKLPFCS
jgi:hypothetical protein